MTTYSKETALYDTGAIKNGIDDAATTASNYLTDITGEGVYVHRDDDNWDSETGDAVKITGESVQILQGGQSVSSFGTEARIGLEDTGRIEIGSDHFKVFDNDSEVMNISTSNSSVSIPTKYIAEHSMTSNLQNVLTHSVDNIQKLSTHTTYKCHIRFKLFSNTNASHDNYAIITNATTTNSSFTKSGTSTGYIYFDGDFNFPQSSDQTVSVPISITFSKVSARYQTGGSWIGKVVESNITKTLNVSFAWSYSNRTITYTFNPVTHTDSSHGTVALWFYRGVTTTYTDYSSTRLAPSYSLGGRDGTPGGYSSTIGYGLKADNNYQTAVGFYNDNQSDTAFEIGNGTGDDNRSNALTVDWDGSITVQNHSSPIGTTHNEYPTSTVSVNSGTATALCSVSLEPGLWLCVCAVRHPQANGGVRRANLRTTSGSTEIDVQELCNANNFVQQQIVRLVRNTGNTNVVYYLNAYQNSGSKLTYVAGDNQYANYICAVRIL